MKRFQKIALLAVMNLGILVIVAALARLILFIRLDLADFLCEFRFNFHEYSTKSPLIRNHCLGTGIQASIWSTVEMQTGLFCVSAPCIRPVLHKVAPGLMSSFSETISRTSNGRHKARASIYGNRTTFTGCIRGTDAYEIHSLNELTSTGNPKGTLTNMVSDGNGKGGWGEEAENSSQVAVLHARSKSGEIVKTVSITITNGTSKENEEDVSGETDVAKFEHV